MVVGMKMEKVILAVSRVAQKKMEKIISNNPEE